MDEDLDDFADFSQAETTDVVISQTTEEQSATEFEDFADFESFQGHSSSLPSSATTEETTVLTSTATTHFNQTTQDVIKSKIKIAFPTSSTLCNSSCPGDFINDSVDVDQVLNHPSTIPIFKDILSDNPVWIRVQNNVPRNASTRLKWITSKTFNQFVSSLDINPSSVDLETGLPVFASHLCLLEPVRVTKEAESSPGKNDAPIPKSQSTPDSLSTQAESSATTPVPNTGQELLSNLDLDFLESTTTTVANSTTDKRPSDLITCLENELLADLQVPLTAVNTSSQAINSSGPSSLEAAEKVIENLLQSNAGSSSMPSSTSLTTGITVECPPLVPSTSSHSPLPLLHPVKNGSLGSSVGNIFGNQKDIKSKSTSFANNILPNGKDSQTTQATLRKTDGFPILSFLRPKK